MLEAYDTTEYKQVIKEAAGQCDYLISYIHWGEEDTIFIQNISMTQEKNF